ncbi:MAG: sigma-70 family RNA polymerase sigma factor [Janthinobacterium lividum]
MADTEDWLTQATNPHCTLAQKHTAFDHLVRNYQDMAFGCAYAILGDFQCAEDAAQDAFLAAWQHLGQLVYPAAFPGWLRRIVVTQCRRQTRNRRLNTISLDDVALQADGNMALIAEQQETHGELTAAIGQLPEGERIVVVLFYLNEYSQREIAAFLDISESTVKKRLASARKRLKEGMTVVMEDQLKQQRPSRDDDFEKKISQFTLGFSVLIDGGESIVRSLLTLAHQQEDSLFQQALTQIRLDIETASDFTHALSDALAKYPQFFHEQYVAQVRAGEQSDLRVAFHSLAVSDKKQ